MFRRGTFPSFRLARFARDPARVLEIDPLSETEVVETLTQNAFDPGLLDPSQVEILRTPQNLGLFLEAKVSGDGLRRFVSVKGLYDAFWEHKREQVTLRANPSPDAWTQAIDALLNAMNAARQLSVPLAALDECPQPYVQAMVSESVILIDDGRYAFAHESLFDYCFARRFTAKWQRLLPFPQHDRQELFRRAQVRQVLNYLRETDPAAFKREVRFRPRFFPVSAALRTLRGTSPRRSPEGLSGGWRNF